MITLACVCLIFYTKAFFLFGLNNFLFQFNIEINFFYSNNRSLYHKIPKGVIKKIFHPQTHNTHHTPRYYFITPLRIL